MMRAADSQKARSNKALMYCGFAIVAVAIIGLHTYQFHGRSYRQDEAWVLHLALENSIPELVRGRVQDAHPPGWYVVIDIWVALFGHSEFLTRFLSSLCTALSLALLFRLGTDLFDKWVGLLAVFILGTSAFVQFFGHEFRSYAALITATIGMQLMFLRWLRRPCLKCALLYVLFGVGAIYTHYFAVYVIAAQAVLLVLLVRWQRGLYVRALGLFGAIALSLSAWVLPVLNGLIFGLPGGIEHALRNEWESIELLHSQMQLAPAGIGEFLLSVAFIIPISLTRSFDIGTEIDRRCFRFNPEWRKWYLVIVPLVVLPLAFAANAFAPNVTPRNLIIILPPLAILAAFAMRALRWQAQAVLILLLAVPALTTFPVYVANGPYQEIVALMAPDYQAGSPVLIEAPQMWQHIPIAYYTRERLPTRVPNEDLFHLMPFQRYLDIMPGPPVNIAFDATDETLQRFREFIGTAEQVWYIEAGHTSFGSAFLEMLDEQYVPFRAASLDHPAYPHNVTEYRRIPETLQDIFTFGEHITMQAWTLKNSVVVEPCQSVTLESWWLTRTALDANYGMSLVLADSDGAIAQTHAPPAGYLTQQWRPDTLYLDARPLRVPCDIESGEYPLLLVLYDYDSGAPLPVTFIDGTPVGGHAYLTTLVVE
jgi:4-amino-4-deoxy-L-arabinose transferase-like glycosyltransferase